MQAVAEFRIPDKPARQQPGGPVGIHVMLKLRYVLITEQLTQDDVSIAAWLPR